MSFQGFAREQGFSDNQIRIDINSVIKNDLAEADRQTKYRGRNATLEGKWGNLYLNKLIEKHEKETSKRKENFASYMKNREEIQKIVQYNNEVKYEDAGKDRHVRSIGSIIGEGLVNLAVNVGTSAINKEFADERERLGKAKAAKQQANEGEIKDIHGRMNDSARQSISTRALDNLKQSGAEQEKLLVDSADYLHDLDSNISVDEWRSYLRANLGLTEVQRQTALNSPQNTTNNLEQFANNYLGSFNGIEGINLAQVESAQINRAGSMQWRQDMATAFRKKYDLDALLPSVRGIVTEAIKDWEGRSLKRENNNRKAIAVKETRTNYANEFEARGNRADGRRAQVDYMLNPNGGGPTQISGRRDLGWDMLGDFAKTSWGLPEITWFMEPGEHNNWRNLFTEKSARGDEWRTIRANKVKSEQQAFQNTQVEANNGVRRMTEAARDMDPEKAMAVHTSFIAKGKVFEATRGASPEVVNKFNTVLLERARITPAPSVSTAKAQAKKIYPKPARTAHINALATDEAGNTVNWSSYPKGQGSSNIGKTKENLDYILVSFIAKQIDRIGLPAGDPRIETEITRMLNDDTTIKLLQESMKLKTKDADGHPLEGGPIVPNFTLPEIQSNGLDTYNTQVELATAAGRKVGLNEIKLDGLKDWAINISDTIANNNLDQRNTLGRRHPLIDRIRQLNPTWNPGHIYNAAVKYFNKKGMDLQTLPQSQYQTPAEARQFIDQFGAQYGKASVPLQYTIQRNHATHGRHPLNAAASYVTHKYAPGQLPNSALATVTGPANSTQMYKEVAPHLQRLVDDAAAAGHTLKFNSGYRTGSEQQHLYNTKPAGTVARRGESEHELGYSVDFNYSDAGYKWLQQNARKYGFQPFAEGLGPDDPEAWHWTFRGIN